MAESRTNDNKNLWFITCYYHLYIYIHIYILIYVYVHIEGGGRRERECEHTCSPVWPLKLPYKFRISSGFNYSFKWVSKVKTKQISMFQVIAVLKKKTKLKWQSQIKARKFMYFDPWIKHNPIIAKIIELCFLIWNKKITDFKVIVKITSILVYLWLQFPVPVNCQAECRCGLTIKVKEVDGFVTRLS